MATEEDEVRTLLSRHRAQIIRDCSESKMITVLVQKGVLNHANERILNDLNLTATNGIGYGGMDVVGNGNGPGTTIESVVNNTINEQKCTMLIDMIAKCGFEKFKEFCYAIESECPQLIEDLINDRLKNGKFFDVLSFFDDNWECSAAVVSNSNCGIFYMGEDFVLRVSSGVKCETDHSV